MGTFHELVAGYPELMYTGIGVTAFVTGGALIYKIATRKKPVHANVNCWFCNENTVVPYGNRNCWDCPNCDQYNGFQTNGDYNKPIPAQHSEHLNHGVCGSIPASVTPNTQQWVNCEMLLCKKCNNNQSAKVKLLASFIPRDEENYDEEIDAYKHHLEQTYKLCRPCQTAVEYYIKYQNRQLRTVLLSHQLRRTRDSANSFIESSHHVSPPLGVILLRVLTFLICAFLLVTSIYPSPDQSTLPVDPLTLSGGVIPPKPSNISSSSNERSGDVPVWQSLKELLPNGTIESATLVWQQGRDSQLAVVSVGLLTCLTAIFLAGPGRLRRIDAVGSVLWFSKLLLCMTESYMPGTLDWMDTAKLSIISLCCLVSFAAAVVSRKPLGSRKARNGRYLAGRSAVPLAGGPSLFTNSQADSFIPSPPPNISLLINRKQTLRERKASPSSLPGRLMTALRLGTVRSLTRTDSGYLFSGSRPTSQCQDSPPSDYFSLKSGSRPSSPGPSPTPSVAGSVTSSSSSARQRRPLISPARLNISGRSLRLFSREHEPSPVSPSPFSPPASPLVSRPNDMNSVFWDGSVMEERVQHDSSSESSVCKVGTTTETPECSSTSKGFMKQLLWPGLLIVSLTSNIFCISFYIYHNWR
ncbi:transmembrane protein 201 [Xyrichtys novacula]|uniref:Transmembrane protein 201 n=1 Tax=Xyrichtys novacula TaxID=13765 RepID=A0AAV1HII3_XYRNO|nr:transmembrane protein 201 [Xyrichtys novacula]